MIWNFEKFRLSAETIRLLDRQRAYWREVSDFRAGFRKYLKILSQYLIFWELSRFQSRDKQYHAELKIMKTN